MKNTILITRSVREQAFQMSFGKGAKVNLLNASKPLIRLLKLLYTKDETLLIGDIQALLAINVTYFS